MTTTHFTAADETVEAFLRNAIKLMEDCGQAYNEQELRDMIAGALGKWTPGTPEEAAKVSIATEGEGLKAAVVESKSKAKRRAPAVVEGNKYWSDPPEITQIYDWFINGRRSGTVNGNLFIIGPSGSGKTEGTMHACDRLGVPLYIVDCPSITTIEKWVGHKEIDHTGTHFVLSEIMEYFQARKYEPGVVLLDEFTRLHATFHNIAIPILDGRRRIFIPEMHDYIDLHPQTAIIATANIGGRYTGTFNMDHALNERFSFTVERGWPSHEEECKVLSSRYPDIPEEKIRLLVDIATRARQKWATQEVTVPLSTRMLVNAGQMVRDGAPITQALEVCALPKFSNDGGEASERAIIRGIIEGKGGGR